MPTAWNSFPDEIRRMIAEYVLAESYDDFRRMLRFVPKGLVDKYQYVVEDLDAIDQHRFDYDNDDYRS